MSKKILVVGAGAWGTAIANVLSKNNNDVDLWARDKSSVSYTHLTLPTIVLV